jgi:hypothetical protein
MILTDYVIDLGIDIVAIFVLAYVLYFRRHRRADLLLAYVSLNIGIFMAMSLLGSVRVDVALGFGLFAILSIIRLRSSAVTQQEVAYYFVALVMGLANGLDLDSLPLVVLVNVVLLLTMLAVDSRPLRDGARRLDVTLDTVHTDEAALVADLERRLGGKVMHHEVNEIDHARGTMLVDVRYKHGTAPADPTVPERRLEVTLDTVHTNDGALVADLERRLGGRVVHHMAKEVDYVRDITVVDVRCQVRPARLRPAPPRTGRAGPGCSSAAQRPGARTAARSPAARWPAERSWAAVNSPAAPPTVVVPAMRPGSRPAGPPPAARPVPRAAAPPRVATVTETVRIAAHRPAPRPLTGPVSRPAARVPSPRRSGRWPQPPPGCPGSAWTSCWSWPRCRRASTVSTSYPPRPSSV